MGLERGVRNLTPHATSSQPTHIGGFAKHYPRDRSASPHDPVADSHHEKLNKIKKVQRNWLSSWVAYRNRNC